MRFKGIKKREEGQFITRYDVAYETVDQKEKIYEIISRNKMLDSIEALNGGRPDSVVIIATDESSERLLVNKEFRMAVGDWVYNFPGRPDRRGRGACGERKARAVGGDRA